MNTWIAANGLMKPNKKALQVEYIIQYIGMQKQTISKLNFIIKTLNYHTSCI